jgi:hypothetical protein
MEVRMSDNQPVKKFRVGSVTASVWKNDGNLSVTLQKSYKDGEDWKNTETMFEGDAVCAVEALRRAIAFMGK